MSDSTPLKKSRGRARPPSSPIVITNRDVVLFKLLYQYRLLHRVHLSLLAGRPMTRLHRRLFKLASAKYVGTVKDPQQKHIYTLGPEAVDVLIEEAE